jgi:hypothetical protein
VCLSGQFGTLLVLLLSLFGTQFSFLLSLFDTLLITLVEFLDFAPEPPCKWVRMVGNVGDFGMRRFGHGMQADTRCVGAFANDFLARIDVAGRGGRRRDGGRKCVHEQGR